MIPASPVLPSATPAVQALEITFAKYQPEYRPLPAMRLHDDEGTVITRWRLTWLERLRVLVSGNLYLRQLTFGGALQPQLPSVEEPEAHIE